MSVRFALDRKTWSMPVVFVLLLSILFPALYLTATIDPQKHLRDMPVALVVEEQSVPSPASPAQALADAVEAAIDPHRFAVHRMTPQALEAAMASDDVAAAVVIPATFDADIASLLQSSGAAEVHRADVAIRTNAGDGSLSNGLVTGDLTPALAAVTHELGSRLLDMQVRNGIPLSGATAALLDDPVTVHAEPYRALPQQSGFGTSVFFFTLVLTLIGFVGASVINPLVDGALGFAPSELGPLVARRPYIALTRRATLLTKWAILTAIAPAATLIAMIVASGVAHMPIDHPVTLWAFSTAAVIALGVSALTVFALFGGGIGSIVNTLFFIAMSMTSSGGIVPLQALPAFFRWQATFEPFRAVLGGVRSILYFDAAPDAGLNEAWIRVGIGAVIGIALGLLVTTLYARRRMFTRHPLPPTTVAPSGADRRAERTTAE